jgi:hypothetical protein
LEGLLTRVIDWFNLAANSLWILAAAIALAAVSFASWEASLKKVKFRQQLNQSGYQAVLNIAGLMFCLGLAGTSGRWWEIVLWLLLSVWFAFQLVFPLWMSRIRS